MCNQNEIEVGDYVTNSKRPTLNCGLRISVVEVNDTQAKISIFDGEGTHKEYWYEKADLIIMHKSEGGFFK